MDVFQKSHAVVNLLYYTIVIYILVVYLNPLFTGTVLFLSIIYQVITVGKRKVLSDIRLCFFLMIFAFLLNPLLNHRGSYVLGTIMDNPITLEATIFGMEMALLLAACIFLMSGFQRIMTLEKVTCLIGKKVPKLALTFTLACRLIPKFRRDYKEIVSIQKELHTPHYRYRAVDCLIGISLEDTLMMADSMIARGYTVKGKKTRMTRAFTWRDARIVGVMIILFAGILISMWTVGWSISYFPKIKMPELDLWYFVAYVLFFAFTGLPIWLQGKEQIKWYRIHKKYWKS